MGLSRTVSEIDGDFSRKTQKFPTPLYFAPPLKGARNIPLELSIGAGGSKTRMMGLPGRQRSLTTSSAVWIECTNVTDWRTDTGPQQRRAYAYRRAVKKNIRFWCWSSSRSGSRYFGRNIPLPMFLI